MSAYLDWHVGMKVVAARKSDQPPPTPVYGVTYTISFIYIDAEDEVMIDLVELPNPETPKWERGYQACCFRPVQTRQTDISIFLALLNTQDELEEVPFG